MRRSLLPMLALLAALTGSAAGKDRVYRVGVLTPTGTGAGFDSVRSVTLPELAQLGFVEGRNLVIEIRAADGVLDRLPALARELVQTAPDVIIANAPPAIRATREATGTIPIVMSFAGEDPVAAGWVASQSHPGGNVTGLCCSAPSSMANACSSCTRLSRTDGGSPCWSSRACRALAFRRCGPSRRRSASS